MYTTDKRKEVRDKDDTLATWLRSIMLYYTKEKQCGKARHLGPDKASLDNHLNINICNNTQKLLMYSQLDGHYPIRVCLTISNVPARAATCRIISGTISMLSIHHGYSLRWLQPYSRLIYRTCTKKAVKFQILFSFCFLKKVPFTAQNNTKIMTFSIR